MTQTVLSEESLQVLHDELVKKNRELQKKVDELQRGCDDLQSMLEASHLVALVLDGEFRVRALTPAAAQLLTCHPGEEDGLATVSRLLSAPRLPEDVRRAMEQETAIEKDIVLPDGRPFSLRIDPRPGTGPEGVVLTLSAAGSSTGTEGELALQRETAERRARDAEEGERTLRVLMEHVPQGITLADAEGKIRMVSRHGVFLAGCSADELMQERIGEHARSWGLYHRDGVTPAQGTELPLARALADGTVTDNEEWVLRRPDGSAITVLTSARPIHDEAGHIAGGVITWQDITERRRMEENLRESEGRLRQIAEHMPGVFWMNDLESGEMVYVSPRFEEIFGLPVQSVCQDTSSLLSLIHPEDRERVVAALPRQVRGDFDEEFRIVRPDGDVRWVRDRAFPIRDHQGKIHRIAGITEDTTARKQADQDLRESEERLHVLFDESPVGIVLIEVENYRFARFNAMAHRQLGYSAEEFAALSIFDIEAALSPDQVRRRGELFRKGRQQFETRHRTRGGGVREVQVTGQPVQVGGRPYILALFEDITERKHFEDVLMLSEERLRLTTAAASVGTWDWDMEKNTLAWDERCKALFGLSPETPISYERFLEALHPQDRDSTQEAVRRALSGGEDYDHEYRTLWPDGTEHWIHSRGRALWSADGRVVRMTGIALDITGRKETELSLAERTERLGLALDSARLGTWDYEKKEDCLHLDAVSKAMFGFRAKEAVRFSDVIAAIHPEDRPRVERALEAALDPGSDGYYGIEFRVVWPDGSLRWVRGRGRGLFEGEGELRRGVRILGTNMDLTESKLAEAALRESEELYRRIFENAAVGIANVDLDGKWRRINQRLCDIVGYSRQELQQKTFMDITHPEDLSADLEQAGRLLRGEIDSYSMEKRYLHRDGHNVWVQLTGAVQRDEAGNPLFFISVVEDISDRKAAEEALGEKELALRKAKEAAEAGSRAKSEFLANMSHEIRTPMTVILASLEQLREGPVAPEQGQYLEMADESAHRLLGLIDDILDISKIEARKLHIEKEPFELHQCVKKTVGLFSLKAQKKGIRLHCDLSPHVPELVNGDAGRLGQVLINLLGNAVKFTEQGEVCVRVTSDPAGGVRFVVRDTGIGVPSAKMDRLFRSFSQVDSSRTRKHGGTGLGLAVSKGLVELMGGTIWAESEEGRGSEFGFCLPLPSAQVNAVRADEKEVAGPSAGIQILLAEDDPMVRDLMEMILRRKGWEVLVAGSGREALDLWRSRPVDLVFMDVQMPHMDGLEATRAIRRDEGARGSGRTPIIALTAHARREDQEECLRAGMDDCLTKPVNMERLYALAEKYSVSSAAERPTSPSRGR